MSNDLEFVDTLAAEVLDMLKPLEAKFADADAFAATMMEFGWVPPVESVQFAAVKGALRIFKNVDSIKTAVAAFVDAPSIDTASKVFDAIGTALGEMRFPDIASLNTPVPPPLNEAGFWKELLGQLSDALFIDWLRRRLPKPFALLHVTGVVDIRRVTWADPKPAHRIPYEAKKVCWEDLGDAILHPDRLMAKTYGWGGAAFDAQLFLDRVEVAMVALGLRASGVQADNALVARFWGSATPDGSSRLRALDVPLVREGRKGDPNAVDLSLKLVPLPRKGTTSGSAPTFGMALVPTFQGAKAIDEPVGASFRLQASAVAEFAGPAVEVHPEAYPELTLTGPPPTIDLAAALVGKPETSFLLLGSRTSHRIELKGATFDLRLNDALGAQPELRIRCALEGLTVTIQLADGDGFLTKVLGTAPQTLTADTAVTWSSTKGLTFEGQAAMKLQLPLNKKLGPVELQKIVLDLSIDKEGAFDITAAVTAKVSLGALTALIEELGIALKLRENERAPQLGNRSIEQGFKPPKGVALRISEGPVTGGGYLFSDPDKGEYAGAVDISFNAISVKAIGLLNTKFPDGKPGYSLLLIITAEFFPVPLGFGFTLNGVGGLLGINRSYNQDALRAGLRNGSLGSVLFPKNPSANAEALLPTLRSVFPPAEGRFLFGPMVKIGWGPTSLLTIDVGLILNLPSPIRLVVLGRISAVLPDKKVAIVRLQLDVMGSIDFDRGEVSVDAELVDSVLAGFALTGSMALRVGWKATKTFVLSAGGFHPGFTAFPPEYPELKEMKRLAIALAADDNPRIRLESYFALTANTVQFGAKVDLYAKVDTFVGTFSAKAWAGFDAMVQFNPFMFVASLDLGIEIAHNGEPFLSARLYAQVSGPRPWRVLGRVEFTFLGKHEIEVEVRIGEEERPPPTFENLGPRLAKAIVSADAWAAELPGSAGQLVTLRSGTNDVEGLVHPLGTLSVRQREIPLATRLDKFGTALLQPYSGRSFTVQSAALMANGIVVSSLATKDLIDNKEDFAPGQFLALSDHELLARPAFESLPFGVRMGISARRWPSSDAARTPSWAPADLDYDTATLDGADLPPVASATERLDDWLLACLVHAGAAADNPRLADVARHVGPDQRVGVVPETYVVADRETLERIDDEDPRSYSQAAERMDRPNLQLLTAGELR